MAWKEVGCQVDALSGKDCDPSCHLKMGVCEYSYNVVS